MDKKDIYQVADDVDLLLQMMEDSSVADTLYKPTNYWIVYEKMFLPELLKKGLHDFRRRRKSILESFGATDTVLRAELTTKINIKLIHRILKIINSILNRNLILQLKISPSFDMKGITSYFYKEVNNKFKLVNLDLKKCPTSLYGNPEDIITVDNRYYSFTHLTYCSMLADAARHMNFNDGMAICELGGGMGRNAEIIANIFPNATIILIDIPLQLYVTNQYLHTVFGERVISYHRAIRLNPGNGEKFRQTIKGKIIVLPTWIMPKWSDIKVDIFWNSASFQEMEPDVVENYLEIVKKMSPKYIYINALPTGNYWGSWLEGRGGTKEPVKDSYYMKAFNGLYKLITTYDTDYFLRNWDYKSYIFEKV
jgi:putative sugar O-methyltransferase